MAVVKITEKPESASLASSAHVLITQDVSGTETLQRAPLSQLKAQMGEATNLAAEYTSKVYAVGDYCTKDGKMYRCNTAISTAEGWTAAHWTQVTAGAELGDLKSATVNVASVIIPFTESPSGTTAGITYTTTGHTIKCAGTSTNNTSKNVYLFKLSNYGIKAGDTVKFIAESTSTNLYAQIYKSTDGQSWNYGSDVVGSKDYIIPDGIQWILYRTYIPSGSVVDDTIIMSIVLEKDFWQIRKVIAPCDLNNLSQDGIWLLDSGASYTNSPINGSAGFLFSVTPAGFTVQFVVPYTGNIVYKRRGQSGGTWETWTAISGKLDEVIEDLAPDYSDLALPASDGKHCIKDKILYRAVTDIESGETWTQAHWTRVDVGGEIENIINSINKVAETPVPFSSYPNETRDGITYSTIGNKIKCVGTATNITYMNVFLFKLSDYGISSGDIIELVAESTNQNNLYAQLYTSTNGQSWSMVTNVTGSYRYLIPSSVQQILFRTAIPSGAVLNDTIALKIIPQKDYWQIKQALNGCDLNNISQDGIWLLDSTATYTNSPFNGSAGFLFSVSPAGFTVQFAVTYTGNKVYKRRGKSGGAWENWSCISETYDDKYFLQPTGNTADRTSNILSVLNTYGTVRLGPGDYYVNNLTMPAGTAIIGCGPATKLQMIRGVDGCAVQLNSNCVIKDVSIVGADTAPSHSSAIGTRHGILWKGNYTAAQTGPNKSIIDNVYIESFTGGGITCTDTGYTSSNCLMVSNAYITSCWAGINVSYLSEYSKFTNVRCVSCRIGCVNNGGNNLFVNCDFSSNQEIAMLMDNSNGQSPNNTHGSCVACVFNHTASGGVANSGIGIKISGGQNGFIFSGCQIFYSKIVLENSNGIVVSDCNFGSGNADITISGGGAVLFANNMHGGQPTITVTNNSNVHFNNCYVIATGEAVGP